MEDEKLSYEYDNYENIIATPITNSNPQTYTYSTTTNTSTSTYDYGFFDLDPITVTESIETEEDAKDLLEKLNEVEDRIKAKLDEIKGRKIKRRKLDI